MTTYQDTRTRELPGTFVVKEYRKFSKSTTTEVISYPRSIYGLGQKVTSVRTTCKPVPRLHSMVEDRRFLFGKDLESVLKDEITRPEHFKTEMNRKVWELCNPNPCDMLKAEVAAERSQKFALNGIQQPKDPSWAWYDYAWEGDIAAHVLSARLKTLNALQRYTKLSADSKRFQDLAITKAYANAKSPVLPIQVYLGELGETLEMLLNPLTSLRRMLSKGVAGSSRYKSRFRPFRDLVETGSGSWLEYRYGWMPLVFQVEDIIDSFNKRLNEGFPIHIVRGGSHRHYLEDTEHIIRGNNVAAALQIDILERIQNQIRGTAVLATRQKMSVDKFFGNRWSDFLSTAYELKTLSFVWDWFFQIGEWLQAIVPDPDLHVIANSVSVKRCYDHTVAPLAYRISYTTKVPSTVGIYGDNLVIKSARLVESSLVRTVNYQLPVVPTLRKQWLSLARTADAASLTIGKILSLFKHGRRG